MRALLSRIQAAQAGGSPLAFDSAADSPAFTDLVHEGHVTEKYATKLGNGDWSLGGFPRLTDRGRDALAAATTAVTPTAMATRVPGQPARVFDVVIACPGDAADERAAVERVVWDRTKRKVRHTGVVLIPRWWKEDVAPQASGGDAQSLMNDELVDKADVLIALFKFTKGQPTPRADSGTVEEIQRCVARGIPTHVFMSQEPIPRTAPPETAAEMASLEEALRQIAYVSDFKSIEELTDRVRTWLDEDMESFKTVSDETTGARASWQIRYVTDGPIDPDTQLHRGRRGSRVVLTNIGLANATSVRVQIEGPADGTTPTVATRNLLVPEVLAGSPVEIPILMTVKVGPSSMVTIEWTEQGRVYKETVLVSWAVALGARITARIEQRNDGKSGYVVRFRNDGAVLAERVMVAVPGALRTVDVPVDPVDLRPGEEVAVIALVAHQTPWPLSATATWVDDDGDCEQAFQLRPPH